jgi:uncharacterized protein (DUF1697 family)
MSRQIAFLRAINVGGRRLKMETLREILTGMGLGGVETFIASGNAVFDAPADPPDAVEAAIEEALRAALGFEVETLVRTDRELREIAASAPFPPEEIAVETNSLYVTFLRGAPDAAARESVRAMSNPVDELRVHGRELYWLRRRAVGDSMLDDKALGRVLAMPGTNRNMTTVRRMVERYCG